MKDFNEFRKLLTKEKLSDLAKEYAPVIKDAATIAVLIALGILEEYHNWLHS